LLIFLLFVPGGIPVFVLSGSFHPIIPSPVKRNGIPRLPDAPEGPFIMAKDLLQIESDTY
jgi:hypothetical protein